MCRIIFTSKRHNMVEVSIMQRYTGILLQQLVQGFKKTKKTNNNKTNIEGFDKEGNMGNVSFEYMLKWQIIQNWQISVTHSAQFVTWMCTKQIHLKSN